MGLILYQFGERRNKENISYNDALNTFYLWLYGVGHMMKDHSNSKRKHAIAISWTSVCDKQQVIFIIPQTELLAR